MRTPPDYPPTWPSPPLLLQIPGLNQAGVQTTQFTIRLRPGGSCSTAESFLYQGRLWFAAFGTTSRPNSCCGSGSYALQG